jgi:hypothetical protein
MIVASVSVAYSSSKASGTLANEERLLHVCKSRLSRIEIHRRLKRLQSSNSCPGIVLNEINVTRQRFSGCC